MKKARKAAPAKELIVIARIQWKHEDKVVYLVRASKPLKDGTYRLLARGQVSYNGNVYQSVVRDGERYLVYQICFINGNIGGCTCPATTGACYHKKELAAIEANRREAAAPAADVEKVIVTPSTSTEATAEVSDAELDEILADIEFQRSEVTSSRQPADIATAGALNGNAGFNLMKVGPAKKVTPREEWLQELNEDYSASRL